MTLLSDSVQNKDPYLKQSHHDASSTINIIRQKLAKFSAGFGVMKIKPVKTLTAPCIFGDEFFQEKKSRENMAIALVNTTLLIFTEESYRKILHDRDTLIKRRKNFFSMYFKSVNKNAVEILAQYMEPINMKIGKKIYNQGDEIDALYFIGSGEIKVNFILIIHISYNNT